VSQSPSNVAPRNIRVVLLKWRKTTVDWVIRAPAEALRRTIGLWDMARILFGVPTSGSTQYSGSAVEMAQDNRRVGNSGAGRGIETNNTLRDIAWILLCVPKDVQKNSSSA
jgi:hypothetical protein